MKNKLLYKYIITALILVIFFCIIDILIRAFLINKANIIDSFLSIFDNFAIFYKIFITLLIITLCLMIYIINKKQSKETKIGKNLLNRISNGLIARDINGYIIYVNDVLAETLGYKKEDLIKKHIRKYLYDKDGLEHLDKNLNNTEPYYVTLKTINSKPVFTIFSSLKKEYPINPSEDEEIVDLVTDISEIKKLETDLNREKEQFIYIMDNIHEPVYISDPDSYKILYSNEAFNDIWEKGIGEKCHKHIQGLDHPCPFCTNKLIFGNNLGKKHIWEYRNKKTGNWLQCLDMAIKWDKKWVRYEMVLNINNQKKVETVPDKTIDYKIQELISISDSVSYDLHSILEQIDFYCNNIMNKYNNILDDRAKTYLENIKQYSGKMNYLLDNMSTLLNNNNQDTNDNRINLSKMVNDIFEELNSGYTNKIDFQVEDNIYINANYNLIKMIVKNIILNYRKNSQNENNMIINFGTMENNSEKVFYIKSNEENFNDEYIRNVHSKINNIETYKDDTLGLATLQSIMQKHKGRIWFESNMDKELTFYFTIDNSIIK